MEDNPRFRFVSPIFLLGFGIGIFAGVALALLAVMVTNDPEPENGTNFVFIPPTPRPSATAAPTSTPLILPRTTAALNVRLGPGDGFGIIGTISTGDIVEIVGRDESTQWVAVRFPPGSTAVGWLPVSGLEGVTGLGSVDILLPTPLARIFPTIALPPFDGGATGGENGGAVIIPNPGSPPPTSTAAPSGPPDLTLGDISLRPDGRIQITVFNLGPGNLDPVRYSVVVSNGVGSGETLRSVAAGLLVNQAEVFVTDNVQIEDSATVFVSVDPGSFVDDADRSNNSTQVVLAHPPTPAPTPTPRPSIPN